MSLLPLACGQCTRVVLHCQHNRNRWRLREQYGPARVGSITSDLIAAPGTAADALDRVRFAAAAAEITGQRTGFLTRGSVIATPPPSADSLQASENLISRLRGTPLEAVRVVRREFATRLSPDPRVGATPGAGQAPSSSLGPFRDTFNRPVLIDVFNVPVRIGVIRAGTAQPFLFVERPPPTGNGSSLTLGPGSVWIPATLLARACPRRASLG